MKIVITGSRTGIGADLARYLVGDGHDVWGLARADQSSLAEGLGSRFNSSRCDVSLWSDVVRASQEISKAWVRVDAVILCAGTQGEIAPALEADPERWSATVRTNLDGTFFTLRALAPLWQNAEKRAKLLCFSGGGATKARPHFSAYAAAKTGIVRLVETLAEEWKGQPVDINAIAPGAVYTPMTDEVIALGPEKAGRADWEAAVKLRNAGAPDTDKIRALVDFLLSEQSDGLGGKLISAPWDPWRNFIGQTASLTKSENYTLRRQVP